MKLLKWWFYMISNKKIIISQVIIGWVIMLIISGCNTGYKDLVYKNTYQKVQEVIDHSKKLEAKIQDGKTYTGRDIANLWEEVNTQIIQPTALLSETKDLALNDVVSMLSARQTYLTKHYADSSSQLTTNFALYDKSITLQPYPDLTNLLNLKELRENLHSYTVIKIPLYSGN